jgi:hypothetical protein
MKLVPANRPLDEVRALVMQGHQVLRITPRKRGKQGFLWDGDLGRLQMTLRAYRIPNAVIYGEGPWRVKVWDRVLERLKDSAERAKPMGATA